VSIDVSYQPDSQASFPPIATESLITSLVVSLRRNAEHCTATFSGSLAESTQATIDGIADLIAGEESVILDFSRAEVADQGGADAVEVLVRKVRARVTELQITQPRSRPRSSS
jgi:hypothetical protein